MHGLEEMVMLPQPLTPLHLTVCVYVCAVVGVFIREKERERFLKK